MSDLCVRFWGVRNGCPVPGPETARYGGNTACIEVRCGDRVLILEGGTGLRALGLALQRDAGFVEADIFLTDAYLGRIIGLPVFEPFYRIGKRLRLWTPPRAGKEDWLGALLQPPYVSGPIDRMGASVEWNSFALGETHHFEDGLGVTARTLGESKGTVGLRIDHAGVSLVYLPDVGTGEHTAASLIAFARNAELLICGADWRDAVSLARASNAGRLVLSHHAPEQSDKVLDGIGWDAATSLPGTEVASEGLVLRL